MECFFINLRAQVERREFIEQNFARYKRPGWYLNRVEAVGLEELAATPISGAIRDAEKACFLSHRQAVRDALEAPGPALILEDDTIFGPSSCAAIENALQSLGDEGWDVIYADLSVYHAPLMAAMLHMRQELARGTGQALMQAHELPFAGASGYIVNQRAKQTLLDLLDLPVFDRPYDISLRDLMLAGKLRGRVIFPFPLSQSFLADQTQIQESDAQAFGLVCATFRRFIWIDRDLENACVSLDALPPDFVDEEAAAFGRIMSAAFSRRTVPE